MAKEDEMICTEVQCNVLKKLLVKMLRWLVVTCVNATAV